MLHTHDAAGNRIDEVEFHPAWHALMAIGTAAGVHSLAWTDERSGARNPFLLQRLKDKPGNRSNASAEIEYRGSWARMVGEEGRGVATILGMFQHTRLDAAVSAAAIMRQAVGLAIHHCDHRSAFQRRLADQPLMRAVLADLVLDSTAATMLVMRLADAFCATRLDPESGIAAQAYGALPPDTALPEIIAYGRIAAG